MLLGVVEISLRSTRVSVADVGSDSSTRLLAREHRVRARTENLDRLTSLLMVEVEALREFGIERTEVIASSKLRGTRLIRLLDRVSVAIGSGPIRIPSRQERASAAFLGATRPAGAGLGESVTVARIGESGVEVAVGYPGGPPGWFGSRPIGTATIARKARLSDPPRLDQVDAALTGGVRALASLAGPRGDRTLVASTLADQVIELCGSETGLEEIRIGLDSIAGVAVDGLAERFGIDSEAARRLTPTLVLHGALAEALGSRVEPVPDEPVAGRAWLAEAGISVAGRDQV